MEIVKLLPGLKDYIWGGNKLKNQWGKATILNTVAESWELSMHSDGQSTIGSGKFKDKQFSEYLGSGDFLGTNCKKYDRFPLLVKLIDAKYNLSVQVHPNDEYALKNEGDLGKTEMWYIADADKGAGIYLGFNKDTSRIEVESKLKSGEVLGLLNFIEVKKGDSFLINAGTIHAIGEGVTICEVQQSSNVTYRVYDYNRTDKSGNLRPLHTQKALDVLDYKKYNTQNFDSETLAESDCFKVSKITVSSSEQIICNDKSFISLTITDGSGIIEGQTLKKGDTFFIPAGYGKVALQGDFEAVSACVN